MVYRLGKVKENVVQIMWELLGAPDQKSVKFKVLLTVLEGIFLQEEGSKSGSERQKP